MREPRATHAQVGRDTCGHVIYVSVEETDDAESMASMWKDLARIAKRGGKVERMEIEEFRKIATSEWCECPRDKRGKLKPAAAPAPAQSALALVAPALAEGQGEP